MTASHRWVQEMSAPVTRLTFPNVNLKSVYNNMCPKLDKLFL